MIAKDAVAIAEVRLGKLLELYFAGRVRAPLQRSFMAFKSSAWLVVLSGFVEPVLYLFSFGFGVGAFIGGMIGADGSTISYAANIALGLLTSSAINGAIYEISHHRYKAIET